MAISMSRSIGEHDFPIWLLGDSNPKRTESRLKSPFDPRHPTRHGIWTSIADVIQDGVFRQRQGRIDMSKLYIRNAISDADQKPRRNASQWPAAVNTEVAILNRLINRHRPIIIFSFGAFAFEFGRRALEETHVKSSIWNTRELGRQFRTRIAEFTPSATNLMPLLHRSISGGSFLSGHRDFCDCDEADYFQVVGSSISDILIAHQAELPIWLSPLSV